MMQADNFLRQMITENNYLVYEFITNNFITQIYELTNFYMDEPL